ncbi:MAG TPA: HlyD family efflux transporter periplasmic adaptor subunit [Chryseolinea sp.]|nr:HlyD family efflux transporter periplasmic adaptor subunit [Chryseolinea sp.]
MKKIITILYLQLLIFLAGCQSTGSDAQDEATPADIQTPVEVTTISLDTLSDYIELNATSTYLQLNTIKAITSGYLKAVNIQPGQMVKSGQVAFLIKTKESEALGNTINALDSSFRFTGVLTIRAAVSGYVQELNHQPGDYVQDGEQLAVLTDTKSFGFILNVPFELRQYVQPGQNLLISLPDGTSLPGTVSSILPAVDSASQSEQALVRVNTATHIPQNIIGKVRIQKTKKENIITLPKAAILSDESQTNFWVMKMIDSITAVKTSVVKGIEAGGKVEIVSPVFSPGDKIIIVGNYGLPDTAKVKIQ